MQQAIKLSPIDSVLHNVLHELRPTDVLVLGEGIDDCIQHYGALNNHVAINTIPHKRPRTLIRFTKRYDFALVTNFIEHMEKQQAIEMLASLRDVYAQRLMVVVPMGGLWQGNKSRWLTEDLIAMGFILKATFNQNEKEVHVYVFDIDNYKITPDWLNAKYWAHPELYDKYWW